MSRPAIFSRCRTYRYTLRRHWGPGNRFACFIALNPSTADETNNDPTVRRMIGFAKAWGMDGLYVANIFALRSTDPKALYSHPAPVGPKNDTHILRLVNQSEIVIAAWGKHGNHLMRGPSVLQMLKADGVIVRCLGKNRDGSPKHPLYLRSDCRLVEM